MGILKSNDLLSGGAGDSIRERVFNLIFICFASFFHIILNGYYFRDEPTLIFTLVKIYRDKTLYSNDIITTHSLKSFLISLLSFFDKLGVLQPAAFLLYIFFLFLMFLIIFKLAKLICVNKHAAYLAVLFFLIEKPILGGIEVFEPYFSYRTAAIPFLLISVYFILRKRYIISAFILALSFNLHPISAVPVFIFLISMLFFDLSARRKIFIAIFVSIVLSLPIIIWKFCAPGQTIPFLMGSDWMRALKIRSSHHFFPLFSGYGIESITVFFTGIILLLTCKYRNDAGKKTYFFSMLAIFLCVLNFFIMQIIPVSILIHLQLYRSGLFLFLFTMFFLADYILDMNSSFSFFKKTIATVIIILVAGNCFLPVLIFLMAIFLFMGSSNGEKIYRIAGLSAKIILVAAIIMILFNNRWAFLNPFDNKDRRLFKKVDLPGGKDYSSWIDVQLWAKANTSKEDLFITPVYLKGFRFYSERGIVGNWKDGTLAIYDPVFAKDWLERMENFKFLGRIKEYGYHQIPVGSKEDFLSLQETDILKIAKKYGAKYIIMEKERDLNFREKYSNDSFRVYEIN